MYKSNVHVRNLHHTEISYYTVLFHIQNVNCLLHKGSVHLYLPCLVYTVHIFKETAKFSNLLMHWLDSSYGRSEAEVWGKNDQDLAISNLASLF